MKVSGAEMAAMSKSVQKAQAGSDILQKTLAKSAEAQQTLPQGRGDGKGQYINITV